MDNKIRETQGEQTMLAFVKNESTHPSCNHESRVVFFFLTVFEQRHRQLWSIFFGRAYIRKATLYFAPL